MTSVFVIDMLKQKLLMIHVSLCNKWYCGIDFGYIHVDLTVPTEIVQNLTVDRKIDLQAKGFFLKNDWHWLFCFVVRV